MKMKRFLALGLAALMMFSFAACGGKDAENSSGVVAPTVEENTLGAKLWDAFLTEITENPEITAEEMANTLVTNENILFAGGAMPVEPAAEGSEMYFPGFDNYQISGFESGAMFLPMMSSIAFVGYVFELPEGADVNAFMKGLEENCNPRWNICVIADQTVIGSVDNTVFFLMCPNSLATE